MQQISLQYRSLLFVQVVQRNGANYDYYKDRGQSADRVRIRIRKEVRINLCLKHHNAKMFNSFHASEELVEDAENGGLCIMPTMEEGCLDYKKKKKEYED